MPYAAELSPIFIPTPVFRFCGTARKAISRACFPGQHRVCREISSTPAPGPVQPENQRGTGGPTQWPTDTMIVEYTWRIDFELPGATTIILLNSY